jgi:hypothetical protein
MRLFYAFIAFFVWLTVLAAIDPTMSNEFALGTLAIVVAGAMAGGD